MEKEMLTLEQKFRVAGFNLAIRDLSREELQHKLVKNFEAFLKLDNYYKEIINGKMKQELGI